MNASGPSLRDFLEAHLPRSESSVDWPGDALLVVHDDLDLPLGKIRFRARGASGGHRGVGSVAEALAGDSFSRLKVGIGRSEGVEAADYVLEPLEGEERDHLLALAEAAAATLPTWVRSGVEAAANDFNGKDLPGPWTGPAA
jgi:PTH1 family peptidyl-tRNA hydrolase